MKGGKNARLVVKVTAKYTPKANLLQLDHLTKGVHKKILPEVKERSNTGRRNAGIATSGNRNEKEWRCVEASVINTGSKPSGP